MAAAHHLQEVTRKEVEGRAKLGISAFAEALLGIPKILAENSGYDAQVGQAISAMDTNVLFNQGFDMVAATPSSVWQLFPGLKT